MTDKALKLVAGSLLHDIGKVICRPGDGRLHSESGVQFLETEAKIKDEEILDMVRYHHLEALKGAKLSEDSPAYIVYMADNIAAASERGVVDEEGGFDPGLPLDTIFNILNGNKQKLHYNAAPLYEDSGINMPTKAAAPYDEAFYSKMREDLLEALKGADELSTDYINSLLGVLEAYLTYIPSSTSMNERPDISLYDHAKMTAAYAACIGHYLEADGKGDYKNLLLKDGESFYEEKAFMLVSMDISGIQSFIYTIHSEGALRVLRSRSFYLEILMEHMVDQVLGAMNLSRANLIYSGGGHCYILAPNTQEAAYALREQTDSFNEFFLDMFGISLYVASACVPCSSRDLENKPAGSYSALFRALSSELGSQKLRRYRPEQILMLNRGKVLDTARECKVCKTSSRLSANDRCEFCEAMYTFSADILYKDFFTVVKGKDTRGIPLPGGMSVIAQDTEALERIMEEERFVRVYGKNKFYKGKNVTTKLWVGDYTQKNATMEDYARQSAGIERIAILRADVDNLGRAFVSGFEDRYTSLSRTATFSRQMSLFFKHHINGILKEGGYSLTGKSGAPRKASIVYSGGDDLFILGSWDDIIGLALDVSERLEEYSQGTLTISAGIGIYDAKFPLSVSAQETAVLEDASKAYPDSKNPAKNAVTLFCADTEGENHTYSWQELREKVLGEKYAALETYLAESEGKGNSFLYRLLDLIRNMEDRINLARFAYVLARLAPSAAKDDGEAQRRLEGYQEFSRTMFGWVQNKQDRKQLVTAILIYVYLHRERNVEQGLESNPENRVEKNMSEGTSNPMDSNNGKEED